MATHLTTGTGATGSKPLDELARTINSVIAAMSADFGDRFKRAFEAPEDLRQYKRRLYMLLRGKPAAAVVDAYEQMVAEKPGLIPTAPEISYATERVAIAMRRAETERVEAERIAALPPPNPAGMRRIRDGAARIGTEDCEELAEAVAAHEELIRRHTREGRIRRPGLRITPCPTCGNPGTFSRSVAGSETWYCLEHFRKGF